MSLLTGIRVIDYQEHLGTIQTILEGPDKHRVRYFVQPDPPEARSYLWSGSDWTLVHALLSPGHSPAKALAQLTTVTEDILGWNSTPCP